MVDKLEIAFHEFLLLGRQGQNGLVFMDSGCRQGHHDIGIDVDRAHEFGRQHEQIGVDVGSHLTFRDNGVGHQYHNRSGFDGHRVEVKVYLETAFNDKYPRHSAYAYRRNGLVAYQTVGAGQMGEHVIVAVGRKFCHELLKLSYVGSGDGGFHRFVYWLFLLQK